MEVYVQPLADVKQENVEDTVGMVKDEKMDVTAFPSTSQNKLLVKVDCPVCGVGVPKQNINKHLDMCLSRDDKKEGLRRSATDADVGLHLHAAITRLSRDHGAQSRRVAHERRKAPAVIVTTKNQTAEEIEELHSVYPPSQIFSVEDLAAATQHPVNKAVDQTEKWRDTSD
ncbi:E3 ubiquitin- ligase RAD18-like isoform X1 [Labeo rohita]|uniref:E3 ubiquitin-ligase RAD18-like isoform X1 n=1 Tax=Labeo rohita TaxID=84645 RepID=A0A498L8X1_LABRO|nr:E3 ubiquitin- ligase RAD18-like isoform X1 [Labeo rohita]